MQKLVIFALRWSIFAGPVTYEMHTLLTYIFIYYGTAQSQPDIHILTIYNYIIRYVSTYVIVGIDKENYDF